MKTKHYLPILFVGMLFVLATIMLCATPLQTKVEAADVSDLTCDEFSGGYAIITDCNEYASGELVIPETIRGMQVIGIAEGAFANCSKLTSIIFPDSVTYTTIEAGTFSGCSSLTSITIPNGITSIGAGAFSDCRSLTEINLPDSVKSIGAGAFSQTSLESIIIPEGVTSISAYTFSYCSGLKRIEIPASVTSIGDYAFENAFEDSSRVELIEFKGDVPTISDTAFVGVRMLVCYPAGNTTWDESKLLGYGGTLYWYPMGEDGITASGVCGDSLTWTLKKDTLYISGSGAMYDWQGDIWLPDELSPWYHLKSLVQYIVLPEDLTRIGNSAFEDFFALKKIDLPAGITVGRYAFEDCDSLTRVDIPENAVIEFRAFGACSSLSHVSIASSATSFSSCCFQYCPLLITAGPIGGGYNIEFAWTNRIPNGAFSSCEYLTSIVFPEGLTEIGRIAFEGCSGLESVGIPEGVVSIGGDAFSGCRNLKSITIPDSVTNIDDRAFAYSDYCDNKIQLVFEGDAPTFDPTCFYMTTATVYYPCDSSGWEDAIMQNYEEANIKWKPYNCGDPVSFKIADVPDKTVYFVGDTLDLTGLKAVLVHESGYEMPVPAGNLSVGKVDFSKSGKKTVTVQYEGFSTTFEIVVYDTRSVTVDASLYPESEHDYATYLDETKTFTYEGALSLTLTFSVDTHTDADNGYISVYDGDGTVVAMYTGSQAAGQTVQIPGNTFSVRIVSYESGSAFDYAFDSIVASVVVQDEVRFSGASIVLQDDLAVNFKVDKALFEEKGYTNPYVIFEFNGKQTVVRDYTVDGNRYVFSFRDVAPNQMNDTISATLYASYDGIEYASETRTYSVAEYCYSMLELYSDDAYAELRTLLVDLLHYGAKSQIYTNYKTDTLVNAQLTEAQLAWGTSGDPALGTVLNTTYQTVENPTATWKGAGLHLRESVSVRLKFTADSVENLTVKIENGTETWTIPSDKFIEEDGVYYVYFSGLDAGQMRQTLYLTLCNGDTPVSNTACYSIESYAYEKQNSTIDGLAELVKAMMRYGDSAYAYVN